MSRLPVTVSCVAVLQLVCVCLPRRKALLILLFGCVISICCEGFASLDVVRDELNDDCAWNVCL